MDEKEDGNNNYYLELSKNPIRFEAVNQLTNVFFDDSNKDVFAVRSGGVMGVVVKNAADLQPDKNAFNFRMEDHGPVLSIKFSPDRKVLAVQRTNNSVEFMCFNSDGSTGNELTQQCKKNANILGFVWTWSGTNSNNNEVAFITEHGVELYSVVMAKDTITCVKHLKSISATVQWFVWCSQNKIALLASNHGSHLQPYVFKQSHISKLPKVETESGRMALERDVTLGTVYGIPAVLILRHQSGPQTAQVHVHTLNGPGQAPVKSHVLRLGMSGRFAINIVQDLIVVHHQASRSSLMFDLALELGETDGTIRYHKPIAPAKSFKEAHLRLPGLGAPEMHLCELYSPNWVVFQPDIVIDAKLGCLWYIKLSLDRLSDIINDLQICTQVLLNRIDGKNVLLSVLLNFIKKENANLDELTESFHSINGVYKQWIQHSLQMQSALPVVASNNNSLATMDSSSQFRVVITQNDIADILQHLDAESEKLECVLIAYITSLVENDIPVQDSLNQLLVKNMARRGKFTALQQLLQYGVLTDSKPLACLLLSLTNMHPATPQLAMDMLARIHAAEEIQEVLLNEKQIISALKLINYNSNSNNQLELSTNLVRKFLSVAADELCNNPIESTDLNKITFHSILFHFRNNPQFAAAFQKDEKLLSFVITYNSIFL